MAPRLFVRFSTSCANCLHVHILRVLSHNMSIHIHILFFLLIQDWSSRLFNFNHGYAHIPFSKGLKCWWGWHFVVVLSEHQNVLLNKINFKFTYEWSIWWRVIGYSFCREKSFRIIIIGLCVHIKQDNLLRGDIFWSTSDCVSSLTFWCDH